MFVFSPLPIPQYSTVLLYGVYSVSHPGSQTSAADLLACTYDNRQDGSAQHIGIDWCLFQRRPHPQSQRLPMNCFVPRRHPHRSCKHMLTRVTLILPHEELYEERLLRWLTEASRGGQNPCISVEKSFTQPRVADASSSDYHNNLRQTGLNNMNSPRKHRGIARVLHSSIGSIQFTVNLDKICQ